MPTTEKNKFGHAVPVKLQKFGIREFTGLVSTRSKTGLWAQILLDTPFEGEEEVRLWGIEYNFILPVFITRGTRVRFRANINPQTGAFQNKYLNVRLVWDIDNSVSGKKFRKISIEAIE